jgi:hypothetical protein
MPGDGCNAPRQRRGSLQPSEAILNTRANMKKAIYWYFYYPTLTENTVQVCHDVYFSNIKAFSLSIVSSFLQLPIIYNKANVKRPSIYFKLFNRKGCLIPLIESKHRLPNFQLVFHQLVWLDAKTWKYFSFKTSPQVLRNVWFRFTIMDLQYENLVDDNHICIFS